MKLFNLIITTKKEYDEEVRLRIAHKTNQVKHLESLRDLDTTLLLKLRDGYSLNDFVKEYGNRSVQNCYSWNVTARLMPIYFPEVWCDCVEIERLVSEWQCTIFDCKKIDPLKVRMKELPDIILRTEVCRLNCELKK